MGVIVAVDVAVVAVESLSKPGAEPTPVPADLQASTMTMASACSTASKGLRCILCANVSNAAPIFLAASGGSDGEKCFKNLSANEWTVAGAMAGIEGSEEST